ncbi:MAG: ATP synthase F1 subunit gamma [Erysipelotrichaceae bacterium]|nr:ATP synthase F1 subunit gamma [Erysipelotrichaceae bacterium]
MAMSMQQTKARIKSVASTKKITKAMELVATAKLKTAKSINAKVAPYRDEVFEIVSYCVENVDKSTNKYLNENTNSDKKLFIIVTSTLGLCGGYNINMEKFAASQINKEKDEIVLIGTKATSYFNNNGYTINRIIDLPSLDIKETSSKDLMNYIIHQYDLGKYQSVQFLTTRFINSMTFNPESIQLLPLKNLKNTQKLKKELLFEPSPEEVLNNLIPFYLVTALKTLILESMLCEQASRRTAMETATDNAEEIQEKLLLEFNKSRQASITQEITEISGAANARK